MALKPLTIRFDPVSWELIAQEASRHGVSAAEFTRAATLTRAVLSLAANDPSRARELGELADHAQEYLSRPSIFEID